MTEGNETLAFLNSTKLKGEFNDIEQLLSKTRNKSSKQKLA